MWVVPINVRTNGKEIVANAFFDSRSEVILDGTVWESV